MIKTMTTTVKLPHSAHQSILEKIIKDGYGMQGKSKWITEAIEAFLQLPNYPELVDIAHDMEELSDMLSLRLSKALTLQMDEAVIAIRKQYPSMEGVKSNIIRAAIMQRLIRA
jgi:hypothetical protein